MDNKYLKLILIPILALMLINSIFSLLNNREMRQAARDIRNAQNELRKAQAHLDSLKTSVLLIQSDLKAYRTMLDSAKISVYDINTRAKNNDNITTKLLTQMNTKLGKLSVQQSELDKVIEKLPEVIPNKPLN